MADEPNGAQPQHVQAQPSPASWQLQRVADSGPGGQPIWALILHTVVGPLTTFWTGDGMVKFLNDAREQVTGLRLASELPPDPPR